MSDDDSDWMDDIEDTSDGEESEEVQDDSTDDLSHLTPDAMGFEEAKDTDRIWRILCWSLPGHGKTHFSYTMPKPLAFIDTEGKADAIAHKFDMDADEFRLFQPSDYDGAKDALEQATTFLRYWLEKRDQRGTIVVDSMSVMWEWSKQKYTKKYHGTDDPSEVNLSSNIGEKGKSDWKIIKRYHNNLFRSEMLNSDFHLCWTAMSEEDYNRAINEDLNYTPDKPAGEKENVYKATDIIKIDENEEGIPVGILQKSGFIGHRYSGLQYPTFDKHRDVVQEIEEEEAELGEEPIAHDAISYDVSITRGKPTFAEEDNDE